MKNLLKHLTAVADKLFECLSVLQDWHLKG